MVSFEPNISENNTQFDACFCYAVIFLKAFSAQKTFCNSLCSFDNYMKQSAKTGTCMSGTNYFIQCDSGFQQPLACKIQKKTCIYV